MSVRDVIQAAAGASTTVDKTYIEDVFSTYLYTGNGSTKTITNGIDLAAKGGMVWIKSRSSSIGNNDVWDTNRGNTSVLRTNSINAQEISSAGYDLTAFGATGFSLGPGQAAYANANAATYASWTFRKAPKFFDVVTYTGNGVAGRTIPHSLGVAPGMIIVKCTSNGSTDWAVYHRSLGATKYLLLNGTTAGVVSAAPFSNTNPTSSVFSVGTSYWTNGSGYTYVAYLFAHDTTTDGLIQCGGYTGTGAVGNNVTLGWEPQYILVKRTDSSGSWVLQDSMRGMSQTNLEYLLADTSGSAQNDGVGYLIPNATGFSLNTALAPWNASGGTYIYMAIRRGPMRTPTDGTKVFNPVLGSSTAPQFRSSNFTSGIDSALTFYKPGYDDGTNAYPNWNSRLIGTGQVQTPNTRAEITIANNLWDYMNGYGSYTGLGTQWGSWLFKRAPGFFDVVCWSGDGTLNARNHNLGVVPELIIQKIRSSTGDWYVYNAAKYGVLNTTSAFANFTSTLTSTTFTPVSSSGSQTYVTYLFASCPGVSKVGTMTLNGTDQNINCGFTNGARFVMSKRTDAVGNWLIWDTARGIVDAADPILYLNTTGAENTSNDYIDPYPGGFKMTAAAGSGTFLYLAIA